MGLWTRTHNARVQRHPNEFKKHQEFFQGKSLLMPDTGRHFGRSINIHTSGDMRHAHPGRIL